jgi:hypothetical protein
MLISGDRRGAAQERDADTDAAAEYEPDHCGHYQAFHGQASAVSG